MRAVVTAFALGAAAFGVLAFVGSVAVGVAADAAGWGEFSIGLGPIVILEFARSARGTETTFGFGAVLIALAGGILNAAAAAAITRGRR